MRMLVDTDAGVDDTLALFLLMQLVQPSEIDIVATFGNVPLDQALSNVELFIRISHLAPRAILRGSSTPIVGEPRFAEDVHGFDGLGGVTNLSPWRPAAAQPHEDLFARTDLGQYDKIVSIGPMTDLARLTKTTSTFPPLFVMGGAFGSKGNVSPFAEFNFYSDPEAASCVFDYYHGDIFVIPLDVCNKVLLGREYLSDLCDKNKSDTAIFLNLIHQHYMDFYQKAEGVNGCHPHDALAICAAVTDLFEWTRGRVHVTLHGAERGRSLFEIDPAGSHYVARTLDGSRFFTILERAFTRFKEKGAGVVKRME